MDMPNKAAKIRSPREYATITETWKYVFPERMTSQGAIHVPMSKGIFLPEIHKQPPEPCLLSPSDLCTIAFINLLCGVGFRHDDFKGRLAFQADLPVKGHATALVFSGPERALSLVLDGLSNTQLQSIFPKARQVTTASGNTASSNDFWKLANLP
jgi:hypothetical protein